MQTNNTNPIATVYTVITYKVFGSIETTVGFYSKEDAEKNVIDWANDNSYSGAAFTSADEAIDWFIDADENVEVSIRMEETLVYGNKTYYDEDMEMLASENMFMGEFLSKLGYSQDEVSEIANTSMLEKPKQDEVTTVVKLKNGILDEAKSFASHKDAEAFFLLEVAKFEPSISDEDIEACLDNGYWDNKSGDDIFITQNDLVGATQVKQALKVWGVNKHGQEVKEHDMLECAEGSSKWNTHVLFMEDGDKQWWHRECDYYDAKVIGTYIEDGGDIKALDNDKGEDVAIENSDTKQTYKVKVFFDGGNFTTVNMDAKSQELAIAEVMTQMKGICYINHAEATIAEEQCQIKTLDDAKALIGERVDVLENSETSEFNGLVIDTSYTDIDGILITVLDQEDNAWDIHPRHIVRVEADDENNTVAQSGQTHQCCDNCGTHESQYIMSQCPKCGYIGPKATLSSVSPKEGMQVCVGGYDDNASAGQQRFVDEHFGQLFEVLEVGEFSLKLKNVPFRVKHDHVYKVLRQWQGK